MRANQTFRPLAKFLRAARAFRGDLERPPFLPASVKKARTMSIGSDMWLFYHTWKVGTSIRDLNGCYARVKCDNDLAKSDRLDICSSGPGPHAR